MAVWDWYAEGRNSYCEACRVRQKQTAKPINCHGCKGSCPAICPGNRRVFELWRLVNTQWRVGLGGMIGLDYTAVFRIAAVYRMKITPGLFEKLRQLELRALLHNKEG
ncbi:DUF1799 domain-containing protein|uniref:DUF1799 domain-containing protein n=1 Tax=Dendrosporobacter quercicolus TaxID=146817 RepID=UPI000B807831|nr:DUF1799 domain-containing protein [Dendrosporobacter quercicolus DSM 1736]